MSISCLNKVQNVHGGGVAAAAYDPAFLFLRPEVCIPIVPLYFYTLLCIFSLCFALLIGLSVKNSLVRFEKRE